MLVLNFNDISAPDLHRRRAATPHHPFVTDSERGRSCCPVLPPEAVFAPRGKILDWHGFCNKFVIWQGNLIQSPDATHCWSRFEALLPGLGDLAWLVDQAWRLSEPSESATAERSWQTRTTPAMIAFRCCGAAAPTRSPSQVPQNFRL